MIKLLKILGLILKGYALWVLYYVWPPYRMMRKAEALYRISVCEKCEFFTPIRTCGECGCFMDVKTKMRFPMDSFGISIGGCPEKKW